MAKDKKKFRTETDIARVLQRCGGPIVVTLTRLRPKRGRLLDSDNLATSFKAVRDGIAAAMGIDDGSERITWEYAQDKTGDYGVRIEISAGLPARKTI